MTILLNVLDTTISYATYSDVLEERGRYIDVNEGDEKNKITMTLCRNYYMDILYLACIGTSSGIIATSSSGIQLGNLYVLLKQY
jgi:hypothetical protein